MTAVTRVVFDVLSWLVCIVGQPLVNNVSSRRLVLLTRIIEVCAVADHHKKQMRYLREKILSKHPISEWLVRTIGSLSPAYKRRFISTFGLNVILFGAYYRKIFKKREGFFPPFAVILSPTARCNLKCQGCYSGMYEHGIDVLSYACLDQIVSEAKRMGTRMFVVSGGEPFIRADLLDLYERHTDCVFLVYSNGTLIDGTIARRLSEMGNVAVAFSIEGDTAHTDQRRGDGVYNRVMESMRLLRVHGVPFGFSGTYNRENAASFMEDGFYDLMIDLGCCMGVLFAYMPIGRDPDPNLIVTPEQQDAMRATVWSVREKKPIFVMAYSGDGFLVNGCMAGGRRIIHVNSKGDVEPCVFMQYSVSNILEVFASDGCFADVLKTPLMREIREAAISCSTNPLAPCLLVDHNTTFARIIEEFGARAGHTGVEPTSGNIAVHLRRYAEAYRPLADAAYRNCHSPAGILAGD